PVFVDPERRYLSLTRVRRGSLDHREVELADILLGETAVRVSDDHLNRNVCIPGPASPHERRRATGTAHWRPPCWRQVPEVDESTLAGGTDIGEGPDCPDDLDFRPVGMTF